MTTSTLPRFLGPADAGRSVVVPPGHAMQMQLADPAATAAIEGDAVELIEVMGFADTGGRQWEIRAVRPGRSRLLVGGRQPFTVNIEVRAAPDPP